MFKKLFGGKIIFTDVKLCVKRRGENVRGRGLWGGGGWRGWGSGGGGGGVVGRVGGWRGGLSSLRGLRLEARAGVRVGLEALGLGLEFRLDYVISV